MAQSVSISPQKRRWQTWRLCKNWPSFFSLCQHQSQTCSEGNHLGLGFDASVFRMCFLHVFLLYTKLFLVVVIALIFCVWLLSWCVSSYLKKVNALDGKNIAMIDFAMLKGSPMSKIQQDSCTQHVQSMFLFGRFFWRSPSKEAENDGLLNLFLRWLRGTWTQQTLLMRCQKFHHRVKSPQSNSNNRLMEWTMNFLVAKASSHPKDSEKMRCFTFLKKTQGGYKG